MLDGFKKFILRGNVVDMAVGVVIGAAFGGVVTALTKDLLTPLIAAVVKTTGIVKMETIEPMISNKRAFEMALEQLHVMKLNPVAV